MRFIPFILKNLFRRRIRATLTILSITVAVLLFGLLAVIDHAFTGGLAITGADRLIVMNKTSITVPLPIKYKDQILQVPGVSDVSYASPFAGVYIDERNFFPQFAADVDSFLRIYPEFVVPADQRQALLADREGCLVGRKLAARFGWKLGDRIPIRGPIRSDTWEFNIRAISSGRRPEDYETGFFFHHDYFDERRELGKGFVSWYYAKVRSPEQAEEVAAAIDARFAGSPYEVIAQPEKAFAAGLVKQLGNVRALILAIGSVVFFTLLVVTGNTMALAIRERTNEIGVLKTLGFSDRRILTLVLAESITLTLLGGAVGLALAKLFTLLGKEIHPLLPILYLSWARLGLGFGLVLFVGLAAGIIPAFLAMRLRIVHALRRVG
jgi:putative ABC transport system permease protein